jgi:hypothetical protein
MLKNIRVSLLALLLTTSGYIAGSYAQPPGVEVLPGGEHVVHLTQAQEGAISAFVRAHPGFQPANCKTLGRTEAACAEMDKDWLSIVQSKKAEVQTPFALWGDFNHDGILDFVIPFFGSNSVNSWGWRQWFLVVFQGTRDGHFTPVIAVRDRFALCFEGMLYDPVRKRVEYWCPAGGGSFRWTGSRYVMKRIMGD